MEVAWAALAVACAIAMYLWPEWDTVPFFLTWISLTIIYGLFVWSMRTTMLVLLAVSLASAGVLTHHVLTDSDDWKMLFKVPLMGMLFMATVWHARRRVEALEASRRDAVELQATLDRQERFIHDASHELKTPVTIARGHLELLRAEGLEDVEIPLDELRRIDVILGQLLLLATAGQPGFLRPEQVELEPFLEDVFMRWSEVAPRSWHLGPVVSDSVWADPDRLRTAIDALLDNAVKYSCERAPIELRARRGSHGHVVIEVENEGIPIPPEAQRRIFSRFGRVDDARTRAAGGAGLGLAIVEEIANRHGGYCSVRSGPRGSVFSVHIPASAEPAPAPRAPRSQEPETFVDAPWQTLETSNEVPRVI